MAKSIDKTLQDKIDSIIAQQEILAAELKHWQKVQSDYETNRVTIESILSVHAAPDLTSSVKKTRKKRGSGVSSGN